MPLCACGCGQEARIYRGKPRRFIHGHNGKFIAQNRKKRSHSYPLSPQLCLCGCGQMTSGRFNHNTAEYAKYIAGHNGRGHPLSEEHREKIGAAQRGKPKSADAIAKISGPNHYAWQGGHSYAARYPDAFNTRLKRAIRKRDNFTCPACHRGESQLKRKLSVHHIDYDPCNCERTNLMSLCNGCHLRTNNNATRLWWQTFLFGLAMMKEGEWGVA